MMSNRDLPSLLDNHDSESNNGIIYLKTLIYLIYHRVLISFCKLAKHITRDLWTNDNKHTGWLFIQLYINQNLNCDLRTLFTIQMKNQTFVFSSSLSYFYQHLLFILKSNDIHINNKDWGNLDCHKPYHKSHLIQV